MRIAKLLRRTAMAAALGITLTGCFPKSWLLAQPFLIYVELYIRFAGLEIAPYSDPQKASNKFRPETTVEVTGNAGGLDGTYDLQLGSFGHFTGSGKVKRGRFITIKAADTGELRAAVAAILSSQMNGDAVDVTKASGKIKAHQTPGGVKVVCSGKLTFRGAMATGPGAGRAIDGNLKLKGRFPPE